MKIHMMENEEYRHKLEEEVVTLRVKVVNLCKNVEEKGISNQPVNNVEEKCYSLLEMKNEEKDKSYGKFIKIFIKKEECKP
jgi:hypothetical protein